MRSVEKNYCNWRQEIIIVKLSKVESKITVLLAQTSWLASVNFEKPWLALFLFHLIQFLVKLTFCLSQHSGDGGAPKISVPCATQCDHLRHIRSLEPDRAPGEGCPRVSMQGQGNSSAGKGLGILVDSTLSMSQLYTLSVMKGNHTWGCISKNVVSRSREVIILLYFAFLRPHLKYLHLKYCVQFWSSCGKEICILNQLVRRLA